MDFEHAIKMDVRNNPIVRELDRARQRELWRSMLVGGALVAVVLFSLWQRYSVMVVSTQIEGTQRELSRALEAQRRLRLEVERLSASERIEKLARAARMVHADGSTTRIVVRPAGDVARGEQVRRRAWPPVAAMAVAHREVLR
jgi:cell division protein FtsL